MRERVGGGASREGSAHLQHVLVRDLVGGCLEGHCGVVVGVQRHLEVGFRSHVSGRERGERGRGRERERERE